MNFHFILVLFFSTSSKQSGLHQMSNGIELHRDAIVVRYEVLFSNVFFASLKGKEENLVQSSMNLELFSPRKMHFS